MSAFTESFHKSSRGMFDCPALGHVLLPGAGSAWPESYKLKITAEKVIPQRKSILGRHTKVYFNKYDKNFR